MRSSARRWATPVTLILLLSMLGYGLWWGWHQLTRPLVEPTVCVTQSASVLFSTQVTVQVLNGGSAAGLAGQVTGQLADYGFKTKAATNTNEQVPTTIIVGASADSPEVLLVAGFFVDAQTRGDDRKDGTVDVLLGDVYPGFYDEAPTEIEVPGGVICVDDATEAPSQEAIAEEPEKSEEPAEDEG
ncbi:MAG: LytR C-terminal domain-containing protein [Propionibacterium sp.]|nr:LytR C-terminal domain-containing protein [Propionibacterium sp.]